MDTLPGARETSLGLYLRTLALENPSHPYHFLLGRESLLKHPRQIRMEELGACTCDRVLPHWVRVTRAPMANHSGSYHLSPSSSHLHKEL